MPAESEAQRKAAGAALSAKRASSSEGLNGASQSMYEGMTEDELEDFASKSSEAPLIKAIDTFLKYWDNVDDMYGGGYSAYVPAPAPTPVSTPVGEPAGSNVGLDTGASGSSAQTSTPPSTSSTSSQSYMGDPNPPSYTPPATPPTSSSTNSSSSSTSPLNSAGDGMENTSYVDDPGDYVSSPANSPASDPVSSVSSGADVNNQPAVFDYTDQGAGGGIGGYAGVGITPGVDNGSTRTKPFLMVNLTFDTPPSSPKNKSSALPL